MKTREQLQAAIAEQVGAYDRYDPNFDCARTDVWFSLGGRIEPGNGGSYTFMVWRDMHSWYAAFPDYHVTATVGRLSERDLPYFLEKCGRNTQPSNPDAEVMIDIIRAVQAIEAEIRRNDNPPQHTGRTDEGSLADFLDQVRNG